MVVTHNSAAVLPRFIGALEVGQSTSLIRVIRVDNGSSDQLELLSQTIPVTNIWQSNSGFGAGCNRGWRDAQDCEFVVFVNPDAYISADNVMLLARTLDENPSIGVVAPYISDSDSLSKMMGPPWRTRRYPVGQPLSTPHLIRAACMSGSCFAIRTDTLKAMGGFDERFFMYCEENDLFKRVQDSGHIVAVDTSIVVEHEGEAGSVAKGFNRSLQREISKKIFYRKHYSLIEYIVMRGIGKIRACKSSREKRSK
nr:glycosyltransferase family 2 protein [Rhodococcus sp. 1168]